MSQLNVETISGVVNLTATGTVRATSYFGPTTTGHCKILQGDANWTGYIEFNRPNTGRTGFIGYGNATLGPAFHIWGEGYLPVMFGANGQERMRIHPDGWICIGSQNVFARLTVEGEVTMSGQAYAWFTAVGTAPSSGYVASGTGGYSIWASNRISCVELNARSDLRLKEDIKHIPAEDAFAFINNVPAICYKWKNSTDKGDKFGYGAQDIIKAGFPNLVGATPHDNLPEETDEDGLTSPKDAALNVNYDQVIPLLTTAIKEQQKMIKEQQTMIEELRKDIETLKAQVNNK